MNSVLIGLWEGEAVDVGLHQVGEAAVIRQHAIFCRLAKS